MASCWQRVRGVNHNRCSQELLFHLALSLWLSQFFGSVSLALCISLSLSCMLKKVQVHVLLCNSCDHRVLKDRHFIIALEFTVTKW